MLLFIIIITTIIKMHTVACPFSELSMGWVDPWVGLGW